MVSFENYKFIVIFGVLQKQSKQDDKTIWNMLPSMCQVTKNL